MGITSGAGTVQSAGTCLAWFRRAGNVSGQRQLELDGQPNAIVRGSASDTVHRRCWPKISEFDSLIVAPSSATIVTDAGVSAGNVNESFCVRALAIV